jgi:hypothetical protein
MNVTVFWDVTPFTLVGRYQRYGKTAAFILRAADGSNKFIRNVGNDLPDYTASQPIRVIFMAIKIERYERQSTASSFHVRVFEFGT